LNQALCLLSLIGDVLRHEKVEGGVAVFLYHGYVRRGKFYLYIINRPYEIDIRRNHSFPPTLFFPSFLVWPFLSTHCTCRGLLLHPITLKDTHQTHTHTLSLGLLWTRGRTVGETSALSGMYFDTRKWKEALLFLYHGYVRCVKFYFYIINRPEEIHRYTKKTQLSSLHSSFLLS